MKRSFNTNYDKLAHHWIYNNDTAHCYGNRMFSEYASIYSYGYHYKIAQKVQVKKQNIILVNNTTHSVTTTKHRDTVLGAIPSDFLVFRVENVENSKFVHNNNLKDYLIRLKNLLRDAAKARKQNTKESYLISAERLKDEIKDYVKIFKLRTNKKERELLEEGLSEETFSKLEEAERLRNKARRREEIRFNARVLNDSLINIRG